MDTPVLFLDKIDMCLVSTFHKHLGSSHLFFCHNAAFCAEVIVAEEAVQAIVAYHVSFMGECAQNTTLEIKY